MAHSVLDLLSQLYDAVLEPERFPAVVRETIAQLDLRGIFFFGANPTGDLVFSFLEGMPEPYRSLLLGPFMLPERNPVARTCLGRPPMELVSTETVEAELGLSKTDFYRELLVPSRMQEFLGTVLLRDADLVSPLTVFRSNDDRRFDAGDLARLRAILPHYQRAAQLLLRFGALRSEQRAGQDVLDRLPYGVFLLDASGTVSMSNRAAEEILRRRDGLRLHMGKLEAQPPDDGARLDAMIADAALTGSRQGLGSGGALTVARTGDKPRYEVLVAPCGAAPPLPATGRGTAVVVFVTDREHAVEPDPALLQRLYGLTPSEARVALAIATGLKPAEVARTLGVSLNTVRTHLYRVLQKTDTRRQADLVRLLAGGPFGLRLGPATTPKP